MHASVVTAHSTSQSPSSQSARNFRLEGHEGASDIVQPKSMFKGYPVTGTDGVTSRFKSTV